MGGQWLSRTVSSTANGYTCKCWLSPECQAELLSYCWSPSWTCAAAYACVDSGSGSRIPPTSFMYREERVDSHACHTVLRDIVEGQWKKCYRRKGEEGGQERISAASLCSATLVAECESSGSNGL